MDSMWTEMLSPARIPSTAMGPLTRFDLSVSTTNLSPGSTLPRKSGHSTPAQCVSILSRVNTCISSSSASPPGSDTAIPAGPLPPRGIGRLGRERLGPRGVNQAGLHHAHADVIRRLSRSDPR
jgi:hypothetical protein